MTGVQTCALPIWDEEVTRRLVDGVEDRKVLDPLLVQQLHESPARAAKLVLYSGCHQLSAEASIAWWVKSRCNGVTDM